MGKGLTNLERASVLAGEILNDFSEDVKLSTLLRKSAQLARLTNDSANQNWIDKEISGLFNKRGDYDLLLSNGRVFGKTEKQTFRLEHVETLEESIETQKLQLSAAIDPHISLSSANQQQYLHAPLGNHWERNAITINIQTSRAILSRIKGRLYAFVLAKNNALNLSGVASEIFSEVRKNVETKLTTFAPEVLKEVTTAYEAANSNASPNWSNVASGCRRILMQMANLTVPASSEIGTTKNGEEVILNGEKYRLRLKKLFKPNESAGGAIAYDTGSYLVELLDSVDRLNTIGDKNPISQEAAKKIIIYTYLLLDEILDRLPLELSIVEKS